MTLGAAAHFPAWSPHPDVWLLVALFAVGYAIAVVRLGPKWVAPGQSPVTRLQVTCWTLGLLTMWLASDWPVHDIAERSMYSVHMVQHLSLAMVAVPLLLLGTPGWLLREVLRPPSRLFRTARRLARFLPALIVFNLVLVFTHWPAIVDASLRSGWVHFAVHALIFLTSFIVWLPVLSPLPEIPRLSPPPRMIFLFLQSVVPTVPASFLTFGTTPLYHFYEKVPHLWGFSTIDDQRLAGLIMKTGGGILLWAIISVTFFRWAAEEERRDVRGGDRAWQDLDRELTQMGLSNR